MSKSTRRDPAVLAALVWLLADTGFLAGLLLLRAAFLAQSTSGAALALLALVFGLCGQALRRFFRRPDQRVWRLLGIFVSTSLLAGLLLPISPLAAGWIGSVAVGWHALSRAAQRFTQLRWDSTGVAEPLRWFPPLLGAAAALHLFITATSVGAGDSYWYRLMLTDFVAQVFEGEFPVWAGQSLSAFNGAVFPLRVAPGFQHAGLALDLATFHQLHPIALTNALLVATALAGAMSAYTCLALLTRRPWLSSLTAALWLFGPGVLTPVMAGDQYMTFLSIPFLPVVFYACWRVRERDDVTSRVLLGVGLGGAWICHAPVALWTTAFAALLYVARPLSLSRLGREVRLTSIAVLVFVVLAGWVFASTFSLQSETNLATDPTSPVGQIQLAFPGNFLPIGAPGPGLSHYQLGYSVLALLLLAIGRALLRREWAALPFLAACLVMIPVELPVPFLTSAIWTRLPALVLNTTNTWPMQRLMLIWSTLIVFAFAVAFRSAKAGPRPGATLLLFLALIGGLGWSVRESRKLEANTKAGKPKLEAARISFLPENRILTRYSYGGRGAAPAYFSHGYMDPLMENRLLHPTTGGLLIANADAAAPAVVDQDGNPVSIGRCVQSGVLAADGRTIGDFFILSPSLTLEPNTMYALRFDFAKPHKRHVLQLVGDRLFREYMLPDSGAGMERRAEPAGFGSRDAHSRVTTLTNESGKQTTVVARVQMRAQDPESFTYAKFWLYAVHPAELPIQVKSWVPYRATTSTAVPALLETPRMWSHDWKATVNGKAVPVVRTENNLVAVRVPTGTSEAVLRPALPWALVAVYWLTLFGWVAVSLGAMTRLVLTPSPSPHH